MDDEAFKTAVKATEAPMLRVLTACLWSHAGRGKPEKRLAEYLSSVLDGGDNDQLSSRTLMKIIGHDLVPRIKPVASLRSRRGADELNGIIQVSSVSGGSITNAFVAQRARLEQIGSGGLDRISGLDEQRAPPSLQRTGHQRTKLPSAVKCARIGRL